MSSFFSLDNDAYDPISLASLFEAEASIVSLSCLVSFGLACVCRFFVYHTWFFWNLGFHQIRWFLRFRALFRLHDIMMRKLKMFQTLYVDILNIFILVLGATCMHLCSCRLSYGY